MKRKTPKSSHDESKSSQILHPGTRQNNNSRLDNQPSRRNNSVACSETVQSVQSIATNGTWHRRLRKQNSLFDDADKK